MGGFSKHVVVTDSEHDGPVGWWRRWWVWLVGALVVGLVGGGVWAGVLLAGRGEGAPSAGTTPQPTVTAPPTPQPQPTVTATPSPVPAEEGWQVLPGPPFDISWHLAVWAGEEFVVGEQPAPDWELANPELAPPGLAALDPQTGQWRALPDHPAGCRGMDAAVWTGRELVFVGGYTTTDCLVYSDEGPPSLPDESDPVQWLDSYALDVTTGNWRTLSGPPQPLFRGTQAHAAFWTFGPPVWTGQHVLALDTPDPPDPDQPKPMHVMLLDPAGDTWRVGEPIPGPPRREFAWVWTGQRLLVWGGVHTSTGYYDERALPAEEASEAWWDAGQQHWVVGRAEWLADGWAYDPDADTWAPISPAPVPGASRSYAAWTGTEMIVWGGTTGADVWPYQPDPAGAAYNPATDTWRTIADAPADATGEMIVFPSVWTGTEFMVWSEQSFDEPCVAAAYNPATDTWRALPDSPMRNVSHAVWTGDSVLVTGYLSDDVRTGEQPAFAHIVEYQPGPYR